jgi:hypothetical protein
MTDKVSKYDGKLIKLYLPFDLYLDEVCLCLKLEEVPTSRGGDVKLDIFVKGQIASIHCYEDELELLDSSE